MNGMSQDDTYSPRLQPTILSVASPSQTLLSLNYTFNQGTLQAPINNGNLMTITNNLDSNWSRAFAYDELNRVLSAQTPTSANYGVTFVVDPWGNLTNKTQITGKNVVWPMSHAASNLNQFTDMDYDAAGNVTNDRLGHAYVYDAENRISTAGSVTFTYDGDGQRVKKSSGMVYFTGTGSAALLETDLSGNATAEYVFFNGKRITRIDRPTGTPHYYVTDQLGSTAKVTNATGTNIEETNELGAFGEPISGGNGHYVFTGKERDTGGEDYFGARYYAFRVGRFLTPDWSSTPEVVPFGDVGSPQSLNLYAYVLNNPVSKYDPIGHAEKKDDKQDPCKGKDPDFCTTVTAKAEPPLSMMAFFLGVGGHHGLPQQFIKQLPLGPLKDWAKTWVTGRLIGKHTFNTAHRLYNRAIKELLNLDDPKELARLVEKGNRAALEVGDKILKSDNPLIKDFLDGMRTSEGLTGREALSRALAGDSEALGSFMDAAISELGETVAEDGVVE
jgi:RHS repeat-associated protein